MSAASLFTERAVLGYTVQSQQYVFSLQPQRPVVIPMKKSILLILLSLLAQRSAANSAYVMGSLGDSISAGFNATRYGDNRELSWASGVSDGQLVVSHALRLQSILSGRLVEVHNEAFVGADSTQLRRQTSRLLRVSPDYVTIAIGANDVCSWPENYESHIMEYRHSLMDSISRIVERNPRVKIVLAPVPSIPLMREIGIKIPGCQAKWDTMNVCRPLLDGSLTDAQRQGFVARYQHLNEVIAAVAAMYPVNVRFAKSLGEIVFDESSISPLDCFHPSIKGHQQISDHSFDPSWY